MTDKWIKKLWYIYTVEYYSAIQRDEFESVELRWTNLKSVTQSEGSQKEKKKKQISYMNRYIWDLEKCIDEPIFMAGVETLT